MTLEYCVKHCFILLFFFQFFVLLLDTTDHEFAKEILDR